MVEAGEIIRKTKKEWTSSTKIPMFNSIKYLQFFYSLVLIIIYVPIFSGKCDGRKHYHFLTWAWLWNDPKLIAFNKLASCTDSRHSFFLFTLPPLNCWFQTHAHCYDEPVIFSFKFVLKEKDIKDHWHDS